MKKKLVLGALFLLPITAYVFFATGKNHFNHLPLLTESIPELTGFDPVATDEQTKLEDHITVLLFAGNNLPEMHAHVFNLTHKIYKPYYEFEDLQYIVVLQKKPNNKEQVEILLEKLGLVSDTHKWRFLEGTSGMIEALHQSMDTDIRLDGQLDAPQAFIIDKDRNLRGRKDEDGIVFGYNTASIAELNNVMKDDLKILLAEYRLALKRNR